MKLALVDMQDDVVIAWSHAFVHTGDEVEIIFSKFEDVEDYDCLVSPANSYGFMDGGIDAAIATRFPGIEERVQTVLMERHAGLLPVGSAEIIPTDDSQHPYLCVAPTMRFPMRLVGVERANIYYAMWAMLTAVERYNAEHDDCIQRVVCPGFGTFVGGVPPEQSANLQALAYRHWTEERHMSIYTARAREASLTKLIDRGIETTEAPTATPPTAGDDSSAPLHNIDIEPERVYDPDDLLDMPDVDISHIPVAKHDFSEHAEEAAATDDGTPPQEVIDQLIEMLKVKKQPDDQTDEPHNEHD